MSLKIDEHLAMKILTSALPDTSIIEKLSRGKAKIISVWKPSESIHLIDVIVARVLSSIAVLNEDISVEVYLSNYENKTDQQAMTKNNARATFYYSLFSELYHKFCGKDRITMKRIFPSEDLLKQEHSDERLKELMCKYSNFIQNTSQFGNNIAIKINEKKWPQDIDYMGSILGLIQKEQPAYIFCGKNHSWIWMDGIIGRFFKNIAQEDLSSQMLYVKTIKGLNGQKHDESKHETFIAVQSSYSEIIRKLKEVKLETDQYIKRFLELFCFSCGNSDVKINNCTINKVEDFYSYLKAPLSNEPSKKATASRIIYESLHEIKNIEQLHQRIISGAKPCVINNSSMIEYIESTFEFSTDPFHNKNSSLVDESPLDYLDSYKSSLEGICNHYADFMSQDLSSVVTNMVCQSSQIDILPLLFEKRHRDHFSHQFNVYSLGLFLLNTIVTGNKLLKEVIKEKHGYDSAKRVEYFWLITALLHDHAYPLEYLFKIGPRIRLLSLTGNSPGMAGVTDIENIILEKIVPDIYCYSLRKTHSDLKEVKKTIYDIYQEIYPGQSDFGYNDSFLLNHGVIAAVNLFEKFKANTELTDVYTAIAKHHQPECKLTFEKEPLAVLLRLCDELHEWGRPLLTNNGYKSAIGSMTLNLNHNLEGKYEMPSELLIEFHCNSMDIIKELKWREDIFWMDKQEIMETIQFYSAGQNPQTIKISLKVPSVTYPK